MYVFSYLELHTTLIAWNLYRIIYDALIGTGLIVLPILWLLVSTGAQALGEDRGESHETAVLQIKNVVTGVIVILLCLAPVYPVNPTDVKYRPQTPLPGTPAEVNATSDPTTYSEHFGQTMAPVRVPAWWGLLHSLSAGLTNAVIQRLNTPGELRETRMLLESRNIEDPSVAADYNDFLDGCYWRAKDNYQRLAQQGLLPHDQDVSWAGSDYLINMPGGYRACTGPINCQAAPASLAVQFHSNPDELARRGLGDTCASWWEVIRGDILTQARADQNTFDKIWGGLTGFLGSQTDREREDLLVRKTLENFHVREGLSAEYSVGPGKPGLVDEAADLVGTAALVKEWWDMTVLVNMMKQALPIMTAVVLVFIVMVIPLALLFSAFRISAVIRLSFLYFSFIFFHALLAFASWLDHYLTAMLLHGADLTLMNYLRDDNHLLGYIQKEGLINIVLMGFYIIIPMLWFGVMGAIGMAAAGGMESMATGGGAGSYLRSSARSTSGRVAAGTAGKGKTLAGKGAGKALRWARAGTK